MGGAVISAPMSVEPLQPQTLKISRRSFLDEHARPACRVHHATNFSLVQPGQAPNAYELRR